MKQTVQAKDGAMVLTSNNMKEVNNVCNKMGCLYNGEFLLNGEIEDL